MENIRAEIERMRGRINRQRGEIKKLERAGISTASAEALLARTRANVDNMCAERDRLAAEQRPRYLGRDKFIRGPQMRPR